MPIQPPTGRLGEVAAAQLVAVLGYLDGTYALGLSDGATDTDDVADELLAVFSATWGKPTSILLLDGWIAAEADPQVARTVRFGDRRSKSSEIRASSLTGPQICEKKRALR
jgi:hypothetical protein